MERPLFFLRGLVIGFSIAAPVGPIGLLCIRRTLAGGRRAGLATGLGAAAADAVHGGIAGFGLTAVSGLLVRHDAWLRLVGGVFLCGLGLRILLIRAAPDAAPAGEAGLAGAFGSTFALTLTNPMTILSFAGVFAGVGIGEARDGYLAAGALVGGVFTGSALWWLALSGTVALLRSRFDVRGLRWVNWISGAIITAFGLAALLAWTGATLRVDAGGIVDSAAGTSLR